jgi:hypothetical protein
MRCSRAVSARSASCFPASNRISRAPGAVPLRVTLDVRIEMPGYDPVPRRDLGFVTYSMSRPLIDLVVRRCLERHANITLRPRCRVRELVPSADRTAVIAVCFENADGESETLPADLVVDAPGRVNLTLGLLESIGQPMPEETVIGVDIGYATAVFAIPDNAPSDWKAVRTVPNIRESTRGRWMVTVGGRHGDKPPGDGDWFLAFTRQPRTSTVYDAIRHRRTPRRRPPLRLFGKRLAALRAARNIPARAASIQRRDLPLQPRA